MSEDHFARLKEITNKVVPNEINLLTNYDGWEDSIDLRGKNLKVSIILHEIISSLFNFSRNNIQDNSIPFSLAKSLC
ncbi:hypothetical protein FOA22_03380 [Heyndrickxia oleronia]|uniref:hypothetical protein n=1 Tax=Heyndrickxia oleronia TaxID=38875 RepID=UPI00333989BD